MKKILNNHGLLYILQAFHLLLQYIWGADRMFRKSTVIALRESRDEFMIGEYILIT